jgi:hypothetical protein
MPLILAPRRMSGMGDDGYKAPFQDEMVRIVHSFNGNKGFTAESIQPALVSAATFAQTALDQMNDDRSPTMDRLRAAVGAAMGTQRTRIRIDLTEAIRQLNYLSLLMRKQQDDPYIFKAPDKTWIDVRSAILAPYYAFTSYPEIMAVGTRAANQLFDDLADGLVNLPSSIIREAVTYVGDQVKKIMPAFPWWIGPVVIGTGLVAGGLYAAPFVIRQVMKSKRATATNPRRRRRRR